MFPVPKSLDDEHLSDDESSHTEQKYITSADEAAAAASLDDENTDGYCLLPQEPDNNQEEEDDDDEFLRFARLRVLSSTDDDKNNQPINSPTYPAEPIWATKLESESFPVDDDKANYIKTLMSSIKLPETSVPVWAQYCSEQDWQEKLREQIACRQTTFFSNENK